MAGGAGAGASAGELLAPFGGGRRVPEGTKVRTGRRPSRRRREGKRPNRIRAGGGGTTRGGRVHERGLCSAAPPHRTDDSCPRDAAPVTVPERCNERRPRPPSRRPSRRTPTTRSARSSCAGHAASRRAGSSSPEALTAARKHGSWQRWGYDTLEAYAKAELRLQAGDGRQADRLLLLPPATRAGRPRARPVARADAQLPGGGLPAPRRGQRGRAARHRRRDPPQGPRGGCTRRVRVARVRRRGLPGRRGHEAANGTLPA